METDIIGGFPYADPYCKGCGKPLTLEHAWMTDGCPCNHVLGVNSMNETRWRLLMLLQQNTRAMLGEAVSQALTLKERLEQTFQYDHREQPEGFTR